MPLSAQCPNGAPPPCVASAAARAPSVAILFMEPRSSNAGDSLLAEGLTLDIINTLSSVERLDVRSRWVSRRIAAGGDPMRSAQSLGVDYLVDGVLELTVEQVVVRGALTRSSNGRVVRPIRIERRRAELQGLQATLAQEVAAAVVGQLLPSERARFAVRRADPRVNELLLSAGALFEQYTLPASRQAFQLVRQALALDSGNATAWAQMAWLAGWLRELDAESAAVYMPRMFAAGERAWALDSTLPATMIIGAAMRAFRNDLGPATEQLARRGAAREPGVKSAIALSWVLLNSGRADDAVGVMRAAVQRDSLSPAMWSHAAHRFWQARRFAEAVAARERSLALRPSLWDSMLLRSERGWALLEQRDCAAALDGARTTGDAMLATESLRCLGRISDADSVARIQVARPNLNARDRGTYLAFLGQPDSAFVLLDREYPTSIGHVLMRPAFEPYRSHPRYVALRRRMGLQ